MLFGEHVATLQNKYQTLDKNLDQSVSILRKELAASIEELKQQVDKRFDQLQKSLQAEKSDRLSQNEEMDSSLSRVNTDLLTKIDLETKRIDQALDDQQQESTQYYGRLFAGCKGRSQVISSYV
jgi:alpha-mannosidase